mmetsp:Transcript_28058/g.90339  ORF Transcript_28058/g.90339 Transcript_28058/m.90339 type:complete len:242 (+) Transcript_28058:2750-3475(+)
MQSRWKCDQLSYLVSESQKFLATSSPGPAEARAKSADNGMAKSVPELVFSHCSPPPPVLYSTKARPPGAAFSENFSTMRAWSTSSARVALPSPKGVVPGSGSSGSSHSPPDAAWQPMCKSNCTPSANGTKPSTKTETLPSERTTCQSMRPKLPSNSDVPFRAAGAACFLCFPFFLAGAPPAAAATSAAASSGHSVGRSATRAAPRADCEPASAAGAGGADWTSSSTSMMNSLPPVAFSQCS